MECLMMNSHMRVLKEVNTGYYADEHIRLFLDH